MKMKHKIFTSLASIVAVAPLASTITSCSKFSFDKLAKTIFNETMDEFDNICKIYRPTYGTETISAYLEARMSELSGGYTCSTDWDIFLERQSEWLKGNHQNGNLLLEIPSTIGCEDWPTVGLQAHMDMTCDNQAGGVIKTEIEGDKLHSRDYETALGASDGIGLAMMLSLIKHKDDFKHGPWKFIVTTDAEDGEGGSRYIQDEWIKDIDFLINLDHEDGDSVCVDCAGVQQAGVWLVCKRIDLDDPAIAIPLPYQYELSVSGAAGGASGKILQENPNPVYAIQLAFSTLSKIFQANNADIEFAITDIITDEETSNGGSSLSTNIRIKFATNIGPESTTEVKMNYSRMVSIARQQYINVIATHSDETKLNMSLTQIEPLYYYQYAIPYDQSQAIVNLFSDKYFYGNMKPQGYEGLVQTSNLGPIQMFPHTPALAEYVYIYFELFGRSSKTALLGPDPSGKEIPQFGGMIGAYRDKIKELVDPEHSKIILPVKNMEPFNFDWLEHQGWNNCWEEKTCRSTLLYKEAAKNKGIELKDHKLMAWTECGEFANKRPDINLTCIGPTVVNSKSRNEYVLVSSIKNMAEWLLYTLMNLTK